MDAFRAATDALFADQNIAVTGTYRIGGLGNGITIKIVLSQPITDASLLDARRRARAYTAMVRMSEVAAPAEGDTMVFSAVTYRIRAARLDTVGVVWTLDLDKQ